MPRKRAAESAEAHGMRIEYMALEELKKFPHNPKLHDDGALDESIEEFGFVDPVLLEEQTGFILKGHGRVERLVARKKAGLKAPERIVVQGDRWLVPVVRGVAFSDQKKAGRYVVADNQIASLRGFDPGELKEFSEGWQPEDLKGIGFEPEEFEELIEPLQEARGSTPKDKLAGFNGNVIKQIVLYFPGPQFVKVLTRLEKVMAKTKTANHTDAFEAVLSFYEKHSPK